MLTKSCLKIPLITIDGKEFSLDALKGKPTLINFWFTRCAPCIDEIPILNEMHDNYKDEFNFDAITYESAQKIHDFLEKQPYNFKHIVNATDFIEKLNLENFPTNLFLDKNGIVKFTDYGIPYIQQPGKEAHIGNGKEFISKLKQLK